MVTKFFLYSFEINFSIPTDYKLILIYCIIYSRNGWVGKAESKKIILEAPKICSKSLT